jgi:hypothetical protein
MDQDSWDLIHMRMINGSVENWESLYQKIFRSVNSNYGPSAYLIYCTDTSNQALDG